MSVKRLTARQLRSLVESTMNETPEMHSPEFIIDMMFDDVLDGVRDLLDRVDAFAAEAGGAHSNTGAASGRIYDALESLERAEKLWETR